MEREYESVPTRDHDFAFPSDFDISKPDPLDESYKCQHFAGTERDHPGITDESRRLHGEGFRAAGFVDLRALDERGRMTSDVDKTLTFPTRYYVAVDPGEPHHRCAARKVFGEGDDYTTLPGYRVCESTMWSVGREYLERWRHGPVVEISALARTRGAPARGVYEIFKRMVHEGMVTGELWFFSIVTDTHASLSALIGLQAMQVIGPDIPITGTGITPGVMLRPVVLNPAELFETIRREADVTTNPRLRRRLEHYAAYGLDGAPPAKTA